MPDAVGPHRLPRHALDAAADDQLLLAGHHSHQGEVHGLLTRAAEAVERDAGDVGRPRRREHAMRAMHAPCSPAAVTQPATTSSTSFGSKACRADKRLKRLRQQLLRVDLRERPAVLLAAASRGPDRIDDPGVGHE